MKCKLLLIFLLLSSGSYTCFSQTTLNFTTSARIYDMVADSNNLWVATEGGLSHVNLQTGTRIVYTSANSPIRSNVVKSCFIDSKGNTWVGGNGLYKFDGVNWTSYFGLPNGDSIYSATRITEDKNGRILVLNLGRSVVIIDSTSINSIYQTQLPYTYFTICDFDVDSAGTYWFATGDGLVHYDGTNWTRYDTSNTSMLGAWIKEVRIDKNGIIWVISSNDPVYNAIFKFDGTTWTQLTGAGATQAAEGKFYIDDDNNKYFYGYLNGVYKYNDTAWTVYTAAAGQIPAGPLGCATVKNNILYSANLSTDTVYSYNGLSITPIKINAYDFPHNYFESLVKTSDNSIWFAGLAAVLKTSNGIGFDTIGYFPSSATVTKVVSDNMGSLYFMDLTGSIGKFDGTNWSTIPTNFTVRDIACAPNGDLWLAVDYGLKKYNGVSFQHYTVNDPLSGGNTFCCGVTVTPSGDVWFADFSSIGKLVGTNCTFYSYSNVSFLEPNNNVRVKSDKSGNIWVGNSYTNLLKFDGTNWTNYNSSNSGWPDTSFIYNLYDEGNGTIWFGTYTGIVKYDGTNFTNFNQQIYRLGTDFGVYDLTMDANNNLWYSGAYVIGVFNPDRIDHLEFEPPPLIAGTTYFDANTNGALDTTDIGLPHQKLLLLPDSTFRLSGSTGNYFFNADMGNHTVQYVHDQGWHLTSASDTLNVLVDSVYECCYDFGINPDSVFHKVELSLINDQPGCSSTVPFWISMGNFGSVPENMRVYYIVDTLISVATAFPDTSFSSGDTLFWDFNAIPPFGTRQILLSLNIPGQAFSGDTINYKAGVIDLNSGTLLTSDWISDVISCAYDPNDKTVRPAGILAPHYTLMGDSLVYTIRFQNTGTDTAFTVVVYDTLSTSLDINTFHFIASSHPVDVKYNSKGETRFSFYDINLPDSNANELASHGFVRFSIKAKQGLPDPTVVSNKAYIFFDFNLPIITDSVFNTLVYQLPTGIEKAPYKGGVLVYPNPSNGIINFQLPGGGKKYEIAIYDLYSHQLLNHVISGTNFVLHAKETGPGIFLYRIKNADGDLWYGKFVVIE